MAELITAVGKIHIAVAGTIRTAGKTAVAVANASAVVVAVVDPAAQDQDQDQDLVADKPAVSTCQFVQCY